MTEITFRNAKLVAGQLIIDIPYEHRGAVMNFIRNMKNKENLTYKKGQ